MQDNAQNIDIKAIRKALKLNQTDFGSLIGASLRSVQMYEKGHTKPSADVLLKILELHKQDSAHISKPIYLNNKECNLKECADYLANNYEEAKRVSKLFNLTIKNDNRDYLIEYLESKGFTVKE